MRLAPRRTPPSPGTPVAHLIEGFRYITRNPPVHSILALLGVVSLTGTPYQVLIPIFADRIFHGGARALGTLLGVAGIGALVGALRIAGRTDLKGFTRQIPLFAAGFGATLVTFAYSRDIRLSCAILVVTGFCLMTQLAASNTLIQTLVPDELRGRVMSVYSMMLMGMSPIGSLVAGAAADRIGAPATVAIGGALSVAAAGVFWLRLPKLRAAVRRLLAEQQAGGAAGVMR